MSIEGARQANDDRWRREVVCLLARIADSLDDSGNYEDGELLHVPFNPGVALGYSPLANICEDRAKNGWRLLYVVPHHQYESIAVFQAAHSGRGGSDAQPLD